MWADGKHGRNFLAKARRKSLSRGPCFALSEARSGRIGASTQAEVRPPTPPWPIHSMRTGQGSHPVLLHPIPPLQPTMHTARDVSSCTSTGCVQLAHPIGVGVKGFSSLYFQTHYFKTWNRGAMFEKGTQNWLSSGACGPHVPWMEHTENLQGASLRTKGLT